jgi:transcriptional regulator with XRE-family HTH domain
MGLVPRLLDMRLYSTQMTASVKTVRDFGTTDRLASLRLQLVAGEMAQQIGQRIRVRRLALGLNQRELASLLNEHLQGGAVDNQRVSDWERGVNKPSERYMQAMASVLERDLAWFYGREPVEETPDLLVIAARADQVDGGFQEFRGHVAKLEGRLDRIEDALGNTDSGVLGLLTRQSQILERLEILVATLPSDETTQRLIDELRRGRGAA